MTVQESQTTEDVRPSAGSAAGPSVTLTSSAAAKVRELLDADGDDSSFLRLGVKRAGCSGYAYDMFFDSVIEDTDFVTTTDGVSIAVDAVSIGLINGAVIDFRDNGLDGAGFAIENPNSSGGCGCGKSFS